MTPPPLSRRLKLSYGLGSTAEAVAITATSSFLLLFYNQVRGLDASHVGLALAAGLFVNAVFDPLVGSWSDRTRSKLGRRHPFMYASILPAALCFFAVFNPPAFGELGQLVWLAVMNTLLLQALTLYHTPHLALGGEMSSDYLERTSVMGFNTFCLWIGDSLGWILSFRVFFAASEGFPNGALDPTRWPLFSTTIAIAIFVLLLYSSWSTRSRIPYLPRPAADTPGFGVRELWRDVRRALSNRNYVMLLVGLFFISMMVGVRTGLWLYGATYFWQLTNDDISYFVIGSFAGYLFAAFVVKRLHARFDKRWTGMFALLLYAIGPALPLGLLYLLKWRGARIPARALAASLVPVHLGHGAVTRDGRPFAVLDRDLVGLLPLGTRGARRVGSAGVQLRTRTGWSPFGPAHVVVDAPGRRGASLTHPVPDRHGRARLPLAVHNSWVVFVDPASPSDEATVLLLMAADAPATIREGLAEEVRQRATELAARIQPDEAVTPDDVRRPDTQQARAGTFGSFGQRAGEPDGGSRPAGGFGSFGPRGDADDAVRRSRPPDAGRNPYDFS